MLYRFREAMLVERGLKRHPKDKTPLIPATTTSIPFAEQARRDLLKEINRKIARIQDPDIELPVVRTLNDEINSIIKQVREWDERIRELGGLSRKTQRRIEAFESAALEGDAPEEAINFNGKYYFGRAKELPEVQEFKNLKAAQDEEAKETQKLKKQRLLMYEQVDHFYYGYLDGELESEIAEEVQELTSRLQANPESFDRDWLSGQPLTRVIAHTAPATEEEALEIESVVASIPTQNEVEAHLLERRKQELLSKYAQ